MLSYRVGIWSRLLLAFSFIAGINVLVGVIALLIFERSEQVVEQLAEEYIPDLVQVSGFVKVGGEVVAMAPNILFTDDEESRKVVKRELENLLHSLNEQLEILAIARPEMRARVENLVVLLADNLKALQSSVKQRGELQNHLNRLTEKLRWLYADLIDEVDPLKQDYTYNLDAEIDRIIDAARERQREISSVDLQKSRISKESVEKIHSNGVLLVSLMVQGASLQTVSQLENLSALAADAIALLRQDMKKLEGDISSLTLINVLGEIYQLAEGENSIFSLRTRILANEAQGREILKRNRVYIEDLNSAIKEIVKRAEEVSGVATVGTRRTLQRAKTTLLLMVLISLVTVAGFMWFYVRGNIVARLSALSRAMRAIARGDLGYQVPKGGVDEIGRMAIALRVFRDTAQAVEDANAQAIIDNAAAGLVLADTDGTIRFFNPEAKKLFHVDSDSMAGTSVYDIVSKEDQEIFIFDCNTVRESVDKKHLCRTLVGRRLDGSSFPMDIFIRRVVQRSNTRLMVTVHDVTEREHAHELLSKRVREKTDHLRRINIKLRDEVRQRRRIEGELVQAGKLAALGQFSAGIGHELNQPLSAIRYYLHNGVKLLERGQAETHIQNLSKMEELVERMAKMINHLKTFARVQSAQLNPVIITDTIQRALELVGGRLEENKVSVIRNNFDKECKVYAEETRLEQVLVKIIRNLINRNKDNALEASKDHAEGGGELEINIEQTERVVTLTVCDNGPGITAEPHEKVFDPFYTTKEVGRGLGLGLSIAYNMVKGFGGSMSAMNRETGGACFTVTLQKV